VELLGWRDDETIRDHYRRCRALVFPGEEDYGIVPLEAMACGAPVIAYAAGGALETVVSADAPGEAAATGLLYRPQTTQGLIDAVQRFDGFEAGLHREDLIARAAGFNNDNFVRTFKQVVGAFLRDRGLAEPWGRSLELSDGV
jgi:glycosyltransferase involved in cell wall biosynthesis